MYHFLGSDEFLDVLWPGLKYEFIFLWVQNFKKRGIFATFDLSSCFLKRPQKLTKSSLLIWILLSMCQINGEDFFNFCGHLRKHELYFVLTRYSELEPYKLQLLQTLDFNSKPFTAKTLPCHGPIDPILGLKFLMSPWAWNSFC